jgi:tripartite-type tricarboxylate transporter receptor subunit TctC
MLKRRAFSIAAGTTLAASMLPLPAFAQGMMARTLHFVVPYPPGGPTDLMARILQPALQSRLGMNVVIENRAGAGGNVGSDMVAKSTPDGTTILLASAGPMSVNPSLFKSMPYDPQKDLSAVIQISKFPQVLVVNPQFPAKNIREFLAYAKTHSGELNYGSAGNGTPQHLAGVLFNVLTGASMHHVPYRGAGPALVDLLGNQISLMFDILGSSVGYIRNGQLRALALTTKARSSAVPDIPTLDESGVPGYDFYGWHGIAVAGKTPPAIVANLNRVFNEIFADPAIRKQWEDIGTPIVGGTSQSFADLIRTETDRLGKLVRDANITLD